MADVPYLNHLWDGQKECPGDGLIGWQKWMDQDTCLFVCFWDPYGSLAMLGLPIGVFVGLS